MIFSLHILKWPLEKMEKYSYEVTRSISYFSVGLSIAVRICDANSLGSRFWIDECLFFFCDLVAYKKDPKLIPYWIRFNMHMILSFYRQAHFLHVLV